MLYLTLSAGAVGLCLGLVLVGLTRFPRSPLSRPLIGALVCATLWGVGSLLTDLSAHAGADWAGIAISYTGGIFLPPLWWTVTLYWVAERTRVPIPVKRWVQPPLIWAAAMWLVMMTNPWHGEFMVPVDGARSEYGSGWWVMAVPNHALGVATALAAAWVFRRVREWEVRRQALLILCACALVSAGHLVFVFWPTPPAFDVPVLALAIASAFILAAMRSEAEQRQYTAVLRREVAQRTRQLERANRDLRELQSRLLMAERLGAGEELAGSVAHAINNPLAALLGTVEMELEASRHRDPTLKRVLQLATRAKDVVERTLLLFRRGALKLEPVAPGEMLRDAVAHLEPEAGARGIAIVMKVENDLPPVVVDRALFGEALAGVLHNALEAVGENGTVSVEAEWLRAPDIVELRIADTGPGIPPELREKVFEPFFTTKGGGTGLGLAITRGVVQGHGGRIRIDARPGGGAVVGVELPAGERHAGFDGAPSARSD